MRNTLSLSQAAITFHLIRVSSKFLICKKVQRSEHKLLATSYIMMPFGVFLK